MRKVKSLGKIGREKSRVQEQLEGKRIEFKNNRKGKGQSSRTLGRENDRVQEQQKGKGQSLGTIGWEKIEFRNNRKGQDRVYEKQ